MKGLGENKGIILPAMLVAAAILVCTAGLPKVSADSTNQKTVKAAVISCHGMIDDGLYQSIRRRTEESLGRGVEYLIYDISTYGGLVQSADDISKYLIHKAAQKAHTTAYVSTEAISAGSMVAVACQDILMRENTTIGCSAPITMGDKLEGAEREKIESFLRAAFSRAAQANGYPEALLKAMVSSQIEVYQVLNKKTSQYEYFEKEFLPKDEKTYDLAGRQLVDKEGELLTLTDKKALEYGIARAVVQDLDAALEFLEKRDNVRFDRPVVKMETNWSEEMVRWLNSPVVAGILVMGILLGIYVELNTPGIGLPSLLAIVCLVILVGSKYLIGLANWVEMAILLIGLILLAVELFVLPGFGIAGITGILCIMASLFGMLIKNPPGKVPWPETQLDWQLFDNGILAVFLGAAGFVILAWLFSKYLPKIPVAKKLILASPVETDAVQYGMASEKPLVEIAQKGITLGQLRPCGVAQFGRERVNVISRGEFIDENKEIIVESIEGNNIVVKEIS